MTGAKGCQLASLTHVFQDPLPPPMNCSESTKLTFFGREIVAGTSDDSVCVYDIERRQPILRIPGHENDVNAVCFGDKSSPHILYSGSDDTTIKVWDRRSLADGRAAGTFFGHTEGVTYVDSKGDGR
jgi:DDB1- and CUL4-associated factor 11